MAEKKKAKKKKNRMALRVSGHCPYLCIRRKSFRAGDTRLIVEDRINLFLPRRSRRVLKIAGKPFLYSTVPLFQSSHRLLCYQYCADAMKAHEADFYQHVLVLGCGGGALPRWLLEEYPAVKVDVVDLSPEIISVCREYFLQKWEGSGRLRYYCTDAREFEQKEYSYQFIFCDLFAGIYLAPPVFENAFAVKLYSLLSKEGMLLINCGLTHPDEVMMNYEPVFDDLSLIERTDENAGVIEAIRR